MDVLIPDATVSPGSLLADELARLGHSVHSCKRAGQDSGCAVLDDRSCPLDKSTIDVALAIGGGPGSSQRGDGATCAATHRVPLVLVDPDPDDPLVAHAASTATMADAAARVKAVAEAPLATHTAIAQEIVRGELERAGSQPSAVDIEVRRRSGWLVVELWCSPEVEHGQAQRMATHVVQAVSEYDHWARGIDVLLHGSKSKSTPS